MERRSRLANGRWYVSLDLGEDEHAREVAFHEANPDYIGLGYHVRVHGDEEIGVVVSMEGSGASTIYGVQLRGKIVRTHRHRLTVE